MTEDKKPKSKFAPKTEVDWGAIERHYRAGVKSVAEISREYGVSRPAIEKRADKEGWVRDLSKKIEAATQNKVVAAVAAKVVAEQVADPQAATKKLAKEVAVVEAYSDAAAAVDTENRRDVGKALSTQRGLLDELEALTEPAFRERLEWLGEVMDESGPTPNGGWKTDKVNELYRYVISLAGRIKMAKELAAAHGVYIPLQRKLFGLDGEKKATPYEELLERLGQQAG